jgi:hypothetical protein
MVKICFPNFQVTPRIWENYVQHEERLVKGSQEARTSTENRKFVNPLDICLLITKGGND